MLLYHYSDKDLDNICSLKYIVDHKLNNSKKVKEAYNQFKNEKDLKKIKNYYKYYNKSVFVFPGLISIETLEKVSKYNKTWNKLFKGYVYIIDTKDNLTSIDSYLLYFFPEQVKYIEKSKELKEKDQEKIFNKYGINKKDPNIGKIIASLKKTDPQTHKKLFEELKILELKYFINTLNILKKFGISNPIKNSEIDKHLNFFKKYKNLDKFLLNNKYLKNGGFTENIPQIQIITKRGCLNISSKIKVNSEEYQSLLKTL